MNFKVIEGSNNQREKTPPFFNLPMVVWLIVGSLFLIHFVLQVGGASWTAFAEYTFAFIPARFGTGNFPQPPGAAYWSMLTYGFLHATWGHVALNCLWLAIFSKPVEARLGTSRYLVLLCGSIIAGALASLVLRWGEVVILVGISGGVSGILAASIPLLHGQLDDITKAQSLRPLSPWEIIKNRRASTFALLWLVMTFITASTQYMTGTAFLEQTIVAWEAHLGGFIAGLIAFYALDKTVNRQPKFTLH